MSPSTPPRGYNRPANTEAAAQRRKANNEELRILTERKQAQEKIKEISKLFRKVYRKDQIEPNNRYAAIMNRLEENLEKLRKKMTEPTFQELQNATLFMSAVKQFGHR